MALGHKVYVNTVGTSIRLNCHDDISGGDDFGVAVQKPDGTEVEWSGSLVSGSTSKIEHITVAGDLNLVGTYLLQALVEFNGVWDGPGNTVKMTVYARFK